MKYSNKYANLFINVFWKWMSQIMDNFSTGLVTAARADVKTGLAVYLAELEQQNLCFVIGQFLGPVTKR